MKIAPTEKVSAAAVGGAAAVIIVWIVSLFGVQVPAEVAANGTLLLTLAFAWFKSEHSG